MLKLVLDVDLVLLLARVMVGVVFLYFGWPKIQDLQSNAKDFEKMGFKPGRYWGTLVAILEVFGGLGLLLGLMVSFWSLGFVIHMVAGTIWKITKTDKKFPDWSYDLLLLVLALVLLVFGPGQYTLGYFV